MQIEGHEARYGNDLLEEIEVANVADLRNMRRQCAVSIIVRHPDVPEGVPYGTFYLAGTLDQLLETLAACVPVFVSDMEAGVSETRSAPLSSAGFRSAVYRATVARARMGKRGGIRR